MRAMNTIKTRFAPSPTGHLHLGNARTALFNALAAARGGGTFLLRIEDTDGERSRDEFTRDLMEDLRWLGTPWQEGYGAEGALGPYAQSERLAVYERYYQALAEAGQVYPCFCSEQQLALSRKLQRASGQAPRYSGTCAHLSAGEVAAKVEQGLRPTLRFRVPAGETVSFEDVVRGPQRFASDDIGDFIIRRADGTPAFFFTNAVDDSLMGVDLVLRGEDHLTNTPRQLMILQALGLPAPRYGHISMIVGADGSPLSKRHGSRSLRQLREAGFLPGALLNYLARLGHTYPGEERFMTLAEAAEDFALERLGRAPARFDEGQLEHWQRLAVEREPGDALWRWMEPVVGGVVPQSDRAAFAELVRPNGLFPRDAGRWAEVLYRDPLVRSAEAAAVIGEAGSGFFRAALAAQEASGNDFKALSNAVKGATGAKGKGLFMPLRAALTGEVHGPQMGDLVALMPVERLRVRLAECA
ncbi:glutamate--tRNA ligase [Endothiovibrio diazotrophicus]